jgi:4-nitrophenyl phosphatase
MLIIMETMDTMDTVEKQNTLAKLEALLIDMDGVLWRGSQPMPQLVDFFTFLHQKEIKYAMLTNNSSKTPQRYQQRLADFGVEVSADDIITSARATAQYLAEQSPPGTPVYVIGMDGLQQALLERGFNVIDNAADPGNVDYVVVGWDRELTFAKLADATLHIRAGATFVGTNPDRNWPGDRGLIPGAGAILAALQSASDVEPTIVGKPYPLMYEIAAKNLTSSNSKTAMLGDRLDTDITGGRNAGLKTILVLSGVTTQATLTDSDVQPDLVFEDISALLQAWQAIIT